MGDMPLYDGVDLADLFKEIHQATNRRRDKIESIIVEIRTMITSPEHVIGVAALLKDYIDLLIKSDDSLVKLATVAQKIVMASTQSLDNSNELISPAERELLYKNAQEARDKELAKGIEEINAGLDAIERRHNEQKIK